MFLRNIGQGIQNIVLYSGVAFVGLFSWCSHIFLLVAVMFYVLFLPVLLVQVQFWHCM